MDLFKFQELANMMLKNLLRIQRDNDEVKLITDEFVKWATKELKINLNTVEFDNLIVEHDFSEIRQKKYWIVRLHTIDL